MVDTISRTPYSLAKKARGLNEYVYGELLGLSKDGIVNLVSEKVIY